MYSKEEEQKIREFFKTKNIRDSINVSRQELTDFSYYNNVNFIWKDTLLLINGVYFFQQQPMSDVHKWLTIS